MKTQLEHLWSICQDNFNKFYALTVSYEETLDTLTDRIRWIGVVNSFLRLKQDEKAKLIQEREQEEKEKLRAERQRWIDDIVLTYGTIDLSPKTSKMVDEDVTPVSIGDKKAVVTRDDNVHLVSYTNPLPEEKDVWSISVATPILEELEIPVPQDSHSIFIERASLNHLVEARVVETKISRPQSNVYHTTQEWLDHTQWLDPSNDSKRILLAAFEYDSRKQRQLIENFVQHLSGFKNNCPVGGGGVIHGMVHLNQLITAMPYSYISYFRSYEALDQYVALTVLREISFRDTTGMNQAYGWLRRFLLGPEEDFEPEILAFVKARKWWSPGRIHITGGIKLHN
jgi:hypothetical protein